MRSKIFRFFLGVMLMLVISALLAFNALLLWVATGPRSLAAITPYIENALSSVDESYNVKIDETRLIWDGWKHPVDIRLHNVSVLTREGKIFTVFPEIALGIDILYLPLGQVVPTSLTVSAPVMNLVQNDDRSFGFGFEQSPDDKSVDSSPTVPFSVLLSSFLKQSEAGTLRHLRKIAIHQAQLHVSDIRQHMFFEADGLNIDLARNKDGEIKVISSGKIHYSDNSAEIRTQLAFRPNNPMINGEVEFSELMPDVLAGLFSDNEAIKSFAVPINGTVSMSFDSQGNLNDAGVDIFGHNGSIISKRFSGPVPITTLRLKAAYAANTNSINLETLKANIEGAQLTANGGASFFDTVSDPSATPEIKADLTLHDAPGDKVPVLWPLALSPQTREWVTQSISNGKIEKATLALDIKKGDLAKPVLPKEAVEANIDVENLSILYLPEHPPVSHVKGTIHIDGIGLLADIASADYLEKTKLSDGRVIIDDLNADNPYINVELHADAPARDIVHFLGLPRLKHAEHLGLRENEVKGTVKGEARVGFNFFAPKGKKAEDVISYDVKAVVAGISQKDFLHKFDIVGASGSINVDNSGIEFSGLGEVNGATINKSTVKYLFTPEKGIDTVLDINATCAIENLKRFGYPDLPFMKGAIGVNASVRLGDKAEQVEATLNLDAADINLADIGWQKPSGEGAVLEIATDKKDGALNITSFNLSGKKISAKGSAALSQDFSSLAALNIGKFSLGDNDIEKLRYEKNEKGTQLDITADTLDLSAYMAKDDDGFSFKNFPAIQLNADIGKLILGKDRELSSLKGSLFCDSNICQRANFTGYSDSKKAFSFKIENNSKRQRKLQVTADDAGSFLHASGVLDGMNGGTLTLNGNYRDDESGSTLKGTLDISEHTIKDAPLLGKILSLASLTGFIDALAGNGIRFKQLNMPFTLHNDVVTIEKGKTFGSAIGMTVDGTITFPEKTLDLEGTVVPAYTLNNVLGNVPILGDMLVGGEGQGVFAARYSVKGTEQNAKVGVNPLSILTPGFLRGLFDIFDKPKKTAPN